MPALTRWREGVTALVLYSLAATVLFGRPILGDPSHVIIGRGDATLMVWFLEWWPYALRHGLNPFVTDLVWAPGGVDLAWTTAVPAAGILASPVTLLFGPVVAYNLLCLLAPVLAAWAAFILCRYVTKTFWPSLVAGYLFGFSTYELGHLPGNLNLTLVFLLPLCVYLVMRRLDGAVTPRRFVLWLTLALVVQFLLSSEVLATLTVFGALVMGLAVVVVPPKERARLCSTGGLVAAAYGLAVLALSPWLYHMMAAGVPRGGIFPADLYSSDLLNFVIPTQVTFLGHRVAESIARHYVGNELEEVAYVGLPAMAIVAWFAVAHWSTSAGRILLLSLGLAALATLGPWLRVAGVPTIPLPWALALHLPLINTALPARFMVYVFLLLALIIAVWLGPGGPRGRLKWALVVLSALTLFPNLGSSRWSWSVDTPAFFTTGLYRQYLAPGETVLVLPYGSTGSGMLWQAQTGMRFRMAEGYVNPGTPSSFARWPIVYTFYFGVLMPGYAEQLKAFLAAHHVTAIIVAPQALESPGQQVVIRGQERGLKVIQVFQRIDAAWRRRLFETLDAPPIEVGGVSLYRVPAQVLRSTGEPPLQMEQQADLAQFAALIEAANAHLDRGGRIEDLTPLRTEEEGLLPAYWSGAAPSPTSPGGGRQYWTSTGLWLGPGPAHTVGIGIVGTYPELAPLIARYGERAQQIYFPSPQRFTHPPVAGRGLLVMIFPRSALAHLAALR